MLLSHQSCWINIRTFRSVILPILLTWITYKQMDYILKTDSVNYETYQHPEHPLQHIFRGMYWGGWTGGGLWSNQTWSTYEGTGSKVFKEQFPKAYSFSCALPPASWICQMTGLSVLSMARTFPRASSHERNASHHWLGGSSEHPRLFTMLKRLFPWGLSFQMAVSSVLRVPNAFDIVSPFGGIEECQSPSQDSSAKVNGWYFLIPLKSDHNQLFPKLGWHMCLW